MSSERILKIKTRTWNNVSHGLFDYDSTDYTNRSFTLRSTCELFGSANGSLYTNTSIFHHLEDSEGRQNPQENNTEGLASVLITPENIEIIPKRVPSQEFAEEDFYYVINKASYPKGYPLKENTIIKLGRSFFKILQITLKEENSKSKDIYKSSLIDSLKIHLKGSLTKGIALTQKAKSNSGTVCKICLFEEDDINDPLLTPCKCTGSVKYVHLSCLQHWIKSRLSMVHDQKVITVFWQSLTCELCKYKFPLTVNHNGKEYPLISFDNKSITSYVIIETFTDDGQSTGIHLFDLTSHREFKIGRGRNCDLKFRDASVSRIHSVLSVNKGKVYLTDNDSKFGTLIRIKTSITLNESNLPTIQYGRILIKFSIVKPWTSFFPCIGSILNCTKAKHNEDNLDNPIPSRLSNKLEFTAQISQDTDEVKLRC